MIMTIDTTKAGSANDTFVLPCYNTGVYDAKINWGDGTTSTITSWNDADLTHVYSASGVYTIRIYGSLPTIYFNRSGDKLKVTNILKWGDVVFSSCSQMFSGCSNLTGTYTTQGLSD
jgi:hypothetical protein